MGNEHEAREDKRLAGRLFEGDLGNRPGRTGADQRAVGGGFGCDATGGDGSAETDDARRVFARAKERTHRADGQGKENRAASGTASSAGGETADGGDRSRLEASARRSGAAGARRVGGSGGAAAETIWAREPVPAQRAAVWRDVETAQAIWSDAAGRGAGGPGLRGVACVRERTGVSGVSCGTEAFARRAGARAEARVR